MRRGKWRFPRPTTRGASGSLIPGGLNEAELVTCGRVPEWRAVRRRAVRRRPVGRDRDKPGALGVDLGTGSARAFLFDLEGRRLGGSRLRYSWRVTRDGGVEADADELVRLVFRSVDGALAEASGQAEVVAVGFSALWHTLLGVDGRGAPVTPVYGWNDTRATTAASRLRARLDERAVHARTGARLHPSYPVARLVWLREAHPELFAGVRRWMSLPEYLWFKLTGDHAADLSIAAGSGLLHQEAMEWDPELLGVTGVGAGQLGRIVPGEDAAIRPAAGPAAERWPGLRSALWRMPVGDGACACIGSGCTDEHRMALGIGTSAAVRAVVPALPAEPPPPGLWIYRLGRDRALIGGAISNGGAVRDWLLSILRLPEDSESLDARLAERPPAGHGVAMLPFLAGERSPGWPLDATGALFGLRLGTDRLDLLQAGMEAVAYRLVLLRRLLLEAVPSARTIMASGGALRHSAYWPGLLADALGEPLLLTRDPEASSRGAAMLAFIAAGELEGLKDVPVPRTSVIEPDPARHEAHAAALARHVALARATRSSGSVEP